MPLSFQIFDEVRFILIVYCRLKLAFVPTMVYRGNDKPMLTYRAHKDYVNMAKLQVKTIFLMLFDVPGLPAMRGWRYFMLFAEPWRVALSNQKRSLDPILSCPMSRLIRIVGEGQRPAIR